MVIFAVRSNELMLTVIPGFCRLFSVFLFFVALTGARACSHSVSDASLLVLYMYVHFVIRGQNNIEA